MAASVPDVVITVQDVAVPEQTVDTVNLFGNSEEPSLLEKTTTITTLGDTFPEAIKVESDAQQMDLVGDPLQDLPEAGDGGPVGVLKENVDDISTFMMRYGIETGKYAKKREIVLPAWVVWLVNAWQEAGKELAEEAGENVDDDDDRDTGEDVADLTQTEGLTEKLRRQRQDAISGKPGSHYIYWAMFKMLCSHIERTNAFNNFFNLLIIFNALFLGMKVDDVWTGGFVQFLENAFVSLFFIEVVIRLAADDKDNENMMFLWFDSTIVLVSVFDVWVLPLLLELELDFDLRILQVFRLMRIVRLARLLRLVTWLRPLRLMERSFRRGIAHFMSIVVLLMTIFYASGLVFRSLFAGLGDVWANTPEDFDGNTLKLMVYLFEAMLSGFEWKEKMVDQLLHGNGDSYTIGVLLIMFMFCTKTALAHLLTGSMVENYLTTMELDGAEVRKDELHKVLKLGELDALLEQVDRGSDGSISWEDFKAFASHKNGPKLLNLLGINSRVKDKDDEKNRLLEMRRIYLAFDPVGEGSIPVDMFKVAYLQLKGGDKTLEGLIIDYSFKELLKTTRRPNENTKELDQKLYNITATMKDEEVKMRHMLMDFEEIVEQVQPSLGKFEKVVAQMSTSLKPPTDDSKVVAGACATVTHMKLQQEVNATREAALAFLKSQGKNIDLAALLKTAA